MSEGELVRKKTGDEEDNEDEKNPTLGVYEAEVVDEIKI